MPFAFLRKIQKRLFDKRYLRRRRSFYSSSISGLFTGIAIGIFFSLITDVDFNRWINVFSFEIFPAFIYFLFVLATLFFFYFVGKAIMVFLVLAKINSSKKEELVGFRINFIAGVYSAFWGSSLLFFINEFRILISITLLFLVFYLPIEYIAVKPNGRRN